MVEGTVNLGKLETACFILHCFCLMGQGLEHSKVTKVQKCTTHGVTQMSARMDSGSVWALGNDSIDRYKYGCCAHSGVLCGSLNGSDFHDDHSLTNFSRFHGEYV